MNFKRGIAGVRISDTDFRVIIASDGTTSGKLTEWKWNDVSWTSIVIDSTNTSYKQPAMMFEPATGDLYLFAQDFGATNTPIYRYKNTGGNSWGPRTQVDDSEATARSTTVTQYSDPPPGSARSAPRELVWAYRVANGANFDLKVGTLTLAGPPAPTCPGGSVCWDGGGGDANWSTPANWLPDGVPGTTALVVFNGLSSNNATFDVADTIAALTIDDGYTGTITMAADLLIDHNGAGCTFTQKSGTIDLGSTSFTHQCGWTYTGGTFTAGTGTVVFAGTPVAMDSGPTIFNDVQISMTSSTDFTVTGTMNVDGNLSITEVRNIDTGTIKVKGNVTTTDTSVQGSGIIEFTGGNAPDP